MPIVAQVREEKHIGKSGYLIVRRKTTNKVNNPNIDFLDSSPIKSSNLSSVTKETKASKDDKTTSGLNEVSTKTKWSTRKKVLLGLLVALITCLIIVAIVLSVVLTRTDTAAATNESSPVISAYWSFDNVTTDLYGVYNGILINGASYCPILTNQPYFGAGRALSLSSSSNQSFVVSTPFLNLTYTSFTIEAWIYSMTTYTGDNSIFGQCQCSTCTDQCLYFIVRGSHLYAGFTYNDISGSSTLTMATWYHVAFVYNYETQQQILYLNGVQDTIKSNAGPYQGTNGSIEIGSTSASLAPNYFNGYMCNVGVTTRAKSAAEILYDASVIAYYSFDLPSPDLDNGPNGLDGISVNTGTVLGRVNEAMHFSGSSSYFQAYGFYQAGFGVYANKPFSISMWINPSSTTSGTFIQQSTNQTNAECINMIGLYSAGGLASQLVAETWGCQTIFGPFITINTWTHFSWTYNQTNGYTLYVNGVRSGSTGGGAYTASGVITWLQVGYTFSCSTCILSNAGYQGSIDEIYVHNRELTQSDVTSLANP